MWSPAHLKAKPPVAVGREESKSISILYPEDPNCGLWMEQSVHLIRTMRHSHHSALTCGATIRVPNNIYYSI